MYYKVTIVIPVYNVEFFIERCLLSAFNQSFKSIEYLLIDDRGTDKSIEIAKTIIHSHQRKQDIKIISHHQNQGPGATRNTGIANARGEYIYFLDSDDAISIDAIAKLYEVVTSKKVDVVVGSYTSIDFGNTNKKWEWLFDSNLIEGEFSVANYYLRGGYYVMTWNKLYSLKFLRSKKIYCEPASIHEDVFFSLQVALSARSIITVPAITYFYSFRAGSTMDNLGESNIFHYTETFKLLVNYSKSYTQFSIYNRLIFFVYGQRFSLLEKINNSTHITLEKRNILSKQIAAISFLNLTEIWALKTTPISHKIKFSISLVPYKFQLSFLRVIKYLKRRK